VIWSVASFVFEVPSGAWADVVDRRRLLVLSAVVYAAGFASWTVGSTYAAFALGFVLWGLSSAMMSGTFESLLYDELVARGAEEGYTRLVGRAHATAMTANLLASVSAAPLLAWGGYPLVGWVSVAIAGLQALLAATLPVTTHRQHADPGTVATATERVLVRYVAMLRSGVREASAERAVRRAVLVAAFVVGASAYDEYFPLVARDRHVATAVVPWLVGLTVVGQVVGTALAGRAATMRAATMGRLVAGGGVLVSIGALAPPWLGFVAIAVGYGLLNNAMVVTATRLQEVITGPARATVTSVLGLAEELVALSVYASFAVASGVLSVPVMVALLGVPMVVVGVLVRRGR
jgi:MFS family permease